MSATNSAITHLIAERNAFMAERDTLKAANAALVEALRIFTKAAYSVSSEINQRGHNWSEAYLDEVLPIARAAIALHGGAK